MRILAIGAHPDDVEIACSGTLAIHSKRGDEIFIAHTCNGDCGSVDTDKQKLTEIRKRESDNSAKIINAKVIHGDAEDGNLYYSLENRDKIVEIIRFANPDIIITHTPADYHSDHKFTSQMVVDAGFMATLPQLRTSLPATSRVVPVYFMEPLAGLCFQPVIYVDITEAIDLKLEMMKQHKSQLVWLKDHDDADTMENIRLMAKFRGAQSGVKYAEGFTRCMEGLRVNAQNYLA